MRVRPDFVSDEETVYRFISSPSGYNEMMGLSADCFQLFRDNESYVSAERSVYCSLEEAFANGERIRKWFAEGESFWGVAVLSVAKIRRHPQLEVISKYTETHPGHAGIQMLLPDSVVYRFKKNVPTPMQILALQTYLVSIVEQVLSKRS
jgi:hypothetical protein